MFCRKCGAELEDGTKICPNCGEKQVDDTRETVFCRHCGAVIDADCIICPKCGKQVKELSGTSSPNIIINNANSNINTNQNTVTGNVGKKCSKWTSFLLCLFLGFFGAHKFYEGKTGQGVLYLFTGGLFGIGWIIDTISLLFKPDPYYV